MMGSSGMPLDRREGESQCYRASRNGLVPRLEFNRCWASHAFECAPTFRNAWFPFVSTGSESAQVDLGRSAFLGIEGQWPP
jgi:hypothetical protein